MRGDLVVGLDIGTTKVCTLIGEVSPQNAEHVDVLGVGLSASPGIRRGVVVDIDATVAAIEASVQEASRMAGVEVQKVIVGVTGEHIASLNARGVIAITHLDREITREDVERVLENARGIVLPPDRDILHVLPRDFAVDGQNGIRSPVGMSGARLEVETHIVTGATTFLRNVARCVQRAGLYVDEDDTVLEPIASAEAVLTDDERDLGVALVDIGGGTSDVALFRHGEVCFSGMVPVGGQYVSRDIAAGLRTTLDEAERIKLLYGCCAAAPPPEKLPLPAPNFADDLPLPEDEQSAEQTPAEETLTFTPLGSSDSLTLPVRVLSEIIEPRMAELFQLVQKEIWRGGSGGGGALPAGMVLTGGGALLPGAAALAEQITGLPVRIGSPRGVGAAAEAVNHPSFATAVGLLHWGRRQQAGLSRPESSGGYFAVVRRFLRRLMDPFFGR